MTASVFLLSRLPRSDVSVLRYFWCSPDSQCGHSSADRQGTENNENESKLFVTVAAVALFGFSGQAQAQEKLKIGVIATLSGPPAVLGQQLRTAFNSR